MAEILVLDDIEDAAVLIQRILTRKGHNVSCFCDEDEAITHAAKKKVDLAVLDIKLKKLDGMQVLRELKKLQPQMKALMLTGYPTIESAREALELGAAEYCVKPIDKKELEEKVASLLAN
ncbi:MAG: response regulator [Desulforhopalus sp.]|nr:response regulator [Desulforhopalus sp.]